MCELGGKREVGEGFTGSGESKSGSEVSSWETPLTAGMILVAA